MIPELISKLFESRDVAHVAHLTVKSYAKHKALENYYTGVLGLIDALAESYIGKYGPLDIKINASGYLEPIGYFNQLAEYIEEERKSLKDGYIINQVDSILELVYSTLYKLKNLQ